MMSMPALPWAFCNAASGGSDAARLGIADRPPKGQSWKKRGLSRAIRASFAAAFSSGARAVVKGVMEPPVIDGIITDETEWHGARMVKMMDTSKEMVRTDLLLEEIGYGTDRDNMYLLIRPSLNFPKNADDIEFEISIGMPVDALIRIPLAGGSKGSISVVDSENEDIIRDDFELFAFDEILEVKIPLSKVNHTKSRKIDFKVYLNRKGSNIERCPAAGFFQVTMPGGESEQDPGING